ncbi:hypothetical protein BDV09DRAFT_190707 [Aspergillus tetrazonus]
MTPDPCNKTHPYEALRVSEIGSEPASAATKYKRCPIYYPSEWLLESISSVLALAVLIGIAGIFQYMDDKPLSAWKAGVSLNATISILTTACATLLMHGVSTFIGQLKWLYFRSRKPKKLSYFETFDAASRGAWGSILLLTTTGWSLASVGALITIIRLGFSPFTQQVILIEQRNISIPSNSVTFGYAHSYTRDNLNLVNVRGEAVPQDPKIQSAIFQGLFGVSTPENFSCPGACSWDGSYISLGFKTECKNVTQETLRTETCKHILKSPEVYDLCNMTTPGGVGLSTRYTNTDSVTTYAMNTVSLLVDPILSISQMPNNTDDPSEITRFGIYRGFREGFNLTNLEISDCSLFVTAFEYTGARTNGSDFSFNKTHEVKRAWQREEDQFAPRIYSNESLDAPELSIAGPSLTALNNLFTSSIFVNSWVEGNFQGNNDLGFQAALTLDVNIDERFANMATSMTHNVRYGPNMQPAHGNIIQSVAWVSIRWGYFVVPVVTEVVAIVFAVLSIFSTRKSRNVPLWKSSTLAVLAIQHNEQLGLLHGTDMDLDEIESAAKEAEVRLA